MPLLPPSLYLSLCWDDEFCFFFFCTFFPSVGWLVRLSCAAGGCELGVCQPRVLFPIFFSCEFWVFLISFFVAPHFQVPGTCTHTHPILVFISLMPPFSLVPRYKFFSPHWDWCINDPSVLVNKSWCNPMVYWYDFFWRFPSLTNFLTPFFPLVGLSLNDSWNFLKMKSGAFGLKVLDQVFPILIPPLFSLSSTTAHLERQVPNPISFKYIFLIGPFFALGFHFRWAHPLYSRPPLFWMPPPPNW